MHFIENVPQDVFMRWTLMEIWVNPHYVIGYNWNENCHKIHSNVNIWALKCLHQPLSPSYSSSSCSQSNCYSSWLLTQFWMRSACIAHIVITKLTVNDISLHCAICLCMVGFFIKQRCLFACLIVYFFPSSSSSSSSFYSLPLMFCDCWLLHS